MRSITQRCFTLGLTLAMAAAALQGRASAQDDDERARLHFAAGRSYYEQGEYEDAIREWSVALEFTDRPRLHLNISRAHERLGHFGPAADSIETYLAATPNAEDRTELESRRDALRQLEADATRAAANSPSGAVEDDNATAEAEVDRATQLATRSTAERSVGADDSERSTASNAALWTGLGIGVAAGAGAVVTGIIASNDEDVLAEACNADRTRCMDDDEGSVSAAQARGQSMATVSTILTGVAVVAAVAGVVLYVVLDESEEEEPRTILSGAVTPEAALLTLQGQF